jgi:chromosome segregation ATPase
LRGLSLYFKINNKKDWYLKMTKKNDTRKTNVEYGYFSKLLKEPFDSIEELQEAEEAYNEKLKAKEDAAATKKADAKKVEDAFKALNAARKSYKEDLAQLTKEYAESLDNLKKAFELGKKDIHDKLAEAEDVYSEALKEFTTKYDSYHVTLKDGDFETTLSKQTSDNTPTKKPIDIFDLFSWLL